MRWSYRIFRVKGISVELHLSFLLFFMLVYMASGLQAILFFILVFAVVLAHELMHSLTAILHGIVVQRITLLPIGGLASIELPDDPMLELKVSIVGPLFNFVMAAIGIILLAAVHSSYMGLENVMAGVFSEGFGVDSLSSVLSIIVSLNLVLGAFNMLPAFPMDGGRVFRSVLALWMDYARATRIATSLGQLIFIVMAIVSLLTMNFLWAIIAIFLYYSGGNELRYVSLKSLFGDVALRDIAVPGICYVNSAISWEEFLSTVYRRGQNLYLVVDSEGLMRGVLDMNELAGIDMKRAVGETHGRSYSVMEGGLKAADVLKKLLGRDLVLVVDKGRFIGYMTPETLANAASYISLRRRL